MWISVIFNNTRSKEGNQIGSWYFRIFEKHTFLQQYQNSKILSAFDENYNPKGLKIPYMHAPFLDAEACYLKNWVSSGNFVSQGEAKYKFLKILKSCSIFETFGHFSACELNF